MEDTIQFFTEDFDFSLENETQYTEWLLEIASSHKAEVDQLNYIFSNDEYILELNKQYLDHDYYTDILSFPLNQDPIKGDIFISIERVRDNAEQLKTTAEKELLRVMAHGLLHFIGFDDHSEEDIKDMRQAEENAIELFEKLMKTG